MGSNSLTICKSTRKIAAKSLYKTLKEVLKSKKPVSEYNFAKLWLKNLKSHKSIFPEGWYSPPPNGMGVLFATDKAHKRIEFKTLRDKESWPSKNIFLDRESGFIMVYFSPVDKKSFIIGDFGMSIYLGKNKKIQKALKKDLEIIKEVAEKIKIGKKISDLNVIAKKELTKNNLTNEWWMSYTDITGTNYGHTIPGTDAPWISDELNILKNGKFSEKALVISKKRKFVNASESTIIMPGIGVTLEPRAAQKEDKSIPMVYFHTIITFDIKGKKELLTNFDKIFKLCGMDYMGS